MNNDLYELSKRRRSVRKYSKKNIDESLVNEIMKVALMAPTSFGHQAVEFVIVRNQETIQLLSECKKFGGSQISIANAVIVVMVKTENKKSSEFWIEDGAIASSYILLAAEQYNLGACWVHIRNRMGKINTSDMEIRSLLKIPNEYTVLNLITLGEKDEIKKSYTDEDLHFQNIHFEIY